MAKHKYTISFDLSPAELKKLSIGDEVEVKVRGKVVGVRLEDNYADAVKGEKAKERGYVSVEYSADSLKVEGGNEFARMAMDED